MGEEELAVKFFDCLVLGEHHVKQECPETDIRKRIIDLVLESKTTNYTFRCRGCGWAITEERSES